MKFFLTVFSTFFIIISSAHAWDYEKSRAKTMNSSTNTYIEIKNGRVYKNGKRVKDESVKEIFKDSKASSGRSVTKNVDIKGSYVGKGGIRKSRFGDTVTSAIKKGASSMAPRKKKESDISIGYTAQGRRTPRKVNSSVSIKNSTVNVGTNTNVGVRIKKSTGLSGRKVNNDVRIEKSTVW